ncbi:MAG: ArsA family ATPase, partial [Planctomycetes bacterium]|nr:ArsA family ATPase [Planctomycetota bacterium]
MTSFMAVETRQFIPRFLQQGDLKLLLFGGKGGVGKTTCAAATALRLAQQSPERSFLIVSTDPAHSLRDSFVHPPSLPNLHLLEIDSRKCLQKFKEAHAAHLRQIALRGTFLDEEDVARLLDLSMPGMDEVMAFTEIAELVEGGEYSCIIVDTAATGHTLRLLELPGILRQWIEALDAMLAKHRYMARLYAGRYRKDDVDLFLETLSEEVERLSALLCNRLHCRFVPVMLAERLSVQETRRLVDRLQSLDIPVTDIVVNRIFPSRTDCPTCREVRSSQGVELRRLASEFSDYSLWRVPVQSAEVRGPEQLAGFWRGVRSLEETYLATDLGAMPRPRVERPSKLPRSDVSLLLFAGKGGVGKTTLASATALRLAQA